MSEVVSFQFKVDGADEVVKTFKSINSEATKQTKNTAKLARQEELARKVAAQRILREEIKTLSFKSREEEKAHRSTLARLKKEQKEREKAAKNSPWGKSKESLKNMAGGAAMGVAAVAAAVTAAVVAGVGSAVRDTLDLRGKANRLAVDSRMSGQSAMDSKSITSEFLAASIASGGTVSANDIAAGGSQYVAKTGNLQDFIDNLDTLTTVTAASGSSFEDVAAMAGELSNKFQLSGNELQDAFAQMVMASRSGEFEMKNLADLFGKAASTGKMLGLRGAAGAQSVSGLLQTARGSFGSADETVTGVQSIFKGLTLKEKQLKAAGVKGNSMESLLASSVVKLDKGKIKDIFGDPGFQALSKLTSIADETKAKTKGTAAEKEAAAIDAVTKSLTAAAGSATSFSELQADAATIATSPAVQLSNAWTRLVSVINESSLPETIADMATSFADFAENATPFLEDSFYNISLIAEDLASGFENLLDTLGVASNSKSKMEQRRADRQELKDLRRNRKAAEMSGNTDLIAVLDKQIKNKEQAISLNKEADKQDAAANSLIMDAATEASALTKGLAAVATLPFGGLGSSMLIDSAKSDVTGMAESKDQYANNAAKLRAEADALAADTALQNKTKYELLANSLDTIVKRINDSSNSLNTKVPLGQR